MISVAQAAEQLQISEQYVRRLIKVGRLEADRVGNTWLLQEDLIDNLEIADLHIVNEKKIADRKSTKQLSKTKLNVLSFFSGAMGLDIGLEKAGMHVMLACDVDPATRKTIARNDRGIGIIGDLRSYSVPEILAYANVKNPQQVDVIVGGPPCQAFSTAGRRMGFQDERGNVFLKFIEVISSIKPRYVVVENVRGLMSTPITIDVDDEVLSDFDPKNIKGSSLYFIKKKLEAAGYTLSFNLYNSANFGVPQIRERVVIIGTLAGEPVPYLTPTHAESGFMGLKPWLSFKEAVESLDPEVCDHVEFPKKRLPFIKMLKPGQNWRDLPADVQPIAMGNSFLLGGGKTGFYRRLSWDRPAPTLVTHPAMPATELAHPESDRPLSVQEYKRVQQFPDDWEIQGTLVEQYRQIGNAVPVGLGVAIGKQIVNHHKGVKTVPFLGFPYSRYKRTSDKEWEKDFLAEVGKVSGKLF